MEKVTGCLLLNSIAEVQVSDTTGAEPGTISLLKTKQT